MACRVDGWEEDWKSGASARGGGCALGAVGPRFASPKHRQHSAQTHRHVTPRVSAVGAHPSRHVRSRSLCAGRGAARARQDQRVRGPAASSQASTSRRAAARPTPALRASMISPVPVVLAPLIAVGHRTSRSPSSSSSCARSAGEARRAPPPLPASAAGRRSARGPSRTGPALGASLARGRSGCAGCARQCACVRTVCVRARVLCVGTSVCPCVRPLLPGCSGISATRPAPPPWRCGEIHTLDPLRPFATSVAVVVTGGCHRRLRGVQNSLS